MLFRSFQPILDFFNSSDKTNFVEFIPSLAKTVFALMGGPFRKIAVSGGAIKQSVDELESERLKGVYGPEYFEQTKKAMEKYSPEELNLMYKQEFGGRFKNYFSPFGDLNQTQLLNAIVREHLEGPLVTKIKSTSDNEALDRKSHTSELQSH